MVHGTCPQETLCLFLVQLPCKRIGDLQHVRPPGESPVNGTHRPANRIRMPIARRLTSATSNALSPRRAGPTTCIEAQYTATGKSLRLSPTRTSRLLCTRSEVAGRGGCVPAKLAIYAVVVPEALGIRPLPTVVVSRAHPRTFLAIRASILGRSSFGLRWLPTAAMRQTHGRASERLGRALQSSIRPVKRQPVRHIF